MSFYLNISFSMKILTLKHHFQIEITLQTSLSYQTSLILFNDEFSKHLHFWVYVLKCVFWDVKPTLPMIVSLVLNTSIILLYWSFWIYGDQFVWCMLIFFSYSLTFIVKKNYFCYIVRIINNNNTSNCLLQGANENPPPYLSFRF